MFSTPRPHHALRSSALLLLCALLVIITLLPKSGLAESVTIFTLRAPESDKDRRKDYDNALLKLALEKTRPEWGDYRVVMSPRMTLKRALIDIEQGAFVNPMFKTSASNELCERFGFVNFPVDLGIVGYRVCFASPQVSLRTAAVKTLDDFKRFSIGQGAGWQDIEILRKAGFSVIEAPHYQTLFLMTAKNRFDLFSRGINEIRDEYQANRNVERLEIEPHLALYYPLPRFFFTTKGNDRAIERVTLGLKKAYRDGSLMELWKEYYQESIDFSRIRERTLFRIDNPIIDRINPSYKQYIYQLDQPEKAGAAQ